MKQAKAELYQRKREGKGRKKKTDAISVRIYFNRKYRRYSTGVDLSSNEFEKVRDTNKQVRGKLKESRTKVFFQLQKARNIIDKLEVFTFDAFEDVYFENRDIINGVSHAFDQYINELKEENRLGTAASYRDAKTSLEKFKKDLTFADVTPRFLKRYEREMINQGKSISTVGIYLRSLRAIFNKQNIDRSIYPFGKNKYTIPKGRNIKKALNSKEIAKIFHYQAPEKSMTEKARDYWIFLYLGNGMNVKDFCNLKWKNIDGDMLRYYREKTKDSTRESKEIEVSLKPQAKTIINKWGVRTISKDNYIFPHFENDMTPEKKRRVYKQVNRNINKYMKRIAKDVGINKPVTTYYARHSFATALKRSNVSTEMISELLGHSSLEVTKNYLAGFEKEQIKKQTDVLIQGFDKAN